MDSVHKRSCYIDLLTFLNDVYSSWDARAPYNTIYLDLQKAFDKVSHVRLISKLRSYGLGDHLCEYNKRLAHRYTTADCNSRKHPRGNPEPVVGPKDQSFGRH